MLAAARQIQWSSFATSLWDVVYHCFNFPGLDCNMCVYFWSEMTSPCGLEKKLFCIKYLTALDQPAPVWTSRALKAGIQSNYYAIQLCSVFKIWYKSLPFVQSNLCINCLPWSYFCLGHGWNRFNVIRTMLGATIKCQFDILLLRVRGLYLPSDLFWLKNYCKTFYSWVCGRGWVFLEMYSWILWYWWSDLIKTMFFWFTAVHF